MALPNALSDIFRHKQKSYKMVLISTLLEEMGETPREVSLAKVIDRFQQSMMDRESNHMPVDEPPANLGKSWQSLTPGQLRTVVNNPITALEKIILVDNAQERIGFRPEIAKLLTPSVIRDLRSEADRETELYYRNQGNFSVSLHDLLAQVMNNYHQAKTQPFSGHSIGTLMRQTLPDELRKLSFLKSSTYKIQGSVGMGNWATIPWLAILDKRITESTQRGEYVVYLFSEDMRYLYLTLNQGVTIPLQQGRKEGYEYLKNKVKEIRDFLPLENMTKDSSIELTSSGIGRDYQVSTIAYIRYEKENLPDDETLISDLKNMVDNYSLFVQHGLGGESLESTPIKEAILREKATKENAMESPAQAIKAISDFIKDKGFYFPLGMIENFFLSIKTKPFVILAGISGTGKTKLVQLFAEAIGATEKNGQFQLIPVRPDWNDPTDLLGYHDLSGVFKPGKLTQIFWEASQPENQAKPYFVCLDEMNLARVEHYFSDLLSVMETRRWDEGKICTGSLIEARDLSVLTHHSRSLTIPESLNDLGIPQNVYIFGTVNMDETTYPFSKKVLDRAQTLEFNDIVLDQYPELTESSMKTTAAPDLNVSNAFLISEYLSIKDAFPEFEALIKRTTKQLMEINEVLEEVHAHIGFRVRDTISFYMVYNERFQLLPENDAFDLQLLQKILPRLNGSHSSLKRVLIGLMEIAIGKKLNIEEYMEDAVELYLVYARGKTAPAARYPQSTRKIAYMLRRLEEDGFTSFWLT